MLKISKTKDIPLIFFESIKEINYDNRLWEAYREYLKLSPLNIKLNSKDIVSWRKNNIFDIIDFARLTKILVESKNIDEFIKISMADFDNLAMIIKVAIGNGIVTINKKGLIKDLGLLDKTRKYFRNNIKFIPNNKFNQFPCDDASRFKRAEFLIDRYPFVNYFRFAIIGEDDFLSPLFNNFSNFYPIILEKDERIVKKIKVLNKNAKIYSVDLANDDSFKNSFIPKVKTFITDPPYTLHGSLTFIYRGLSLLSRNEDIKEFYVVLNPTMMGKNIYKIESILSNAGVYLCEVINNFSQYKLPKNYQEFQRTNNFLRSVKLSQGIVEYSSSSSLYVFRTVKPELSKIKKFINYKKIYQHYL